MKRFLVVLAVLMMVGVAGQASAELVDLKENGVNPGQQFSLTIPGFGSIGGVLTGEYVVEIQNSPGWNGVYSGFCVDNARSNSSLSQYNLVPVANDGSNYERAAWLFNKYGSAVTGSFNANTAVATQLAVWELMFDPGNYDFTSGAFTVNGGWTAAQQTAAQTELNEAKNADLSSFDPTGFYLAQSPPVGPSAGIEYQDYMIYSAPEPGILLLLGFGLFGTGVVARRRMKK